MSRVSKERSRGDRCYKTLRLEQELIDCLVSEVGRGLHDLDVEVTENSIILHGRAPSYYVKQLAQAAAMRMQHRPKLVNKIVVDSSTAAFRRAEDACRI